MASPSQRCAACNVCLPLMVAWLGSQAVFRLEMDSANSCVYGATMLLRQAHYHRHSLTDKGARVEGGGQELVQQEPEELSCSKTRASMGHTG